ncbi:unnamed protein product, partial [Amoebophrya sp. A25]
SSPSSSTATSKQQEQQQLEEGPKLRVVSWNVLADGDTGALSCKHDYCPLELRLWKKGGLLPKHFNHGAGVGGCGSSMHVNNGLGGVGGGGANATANSTPCSTSGNMEQQHQFFHPSSGGQHHHQYPPTAGAGQLQHQVLDPNYIQHLWNQVPGGGRLHRVVKRIRELNPDLLCLQECPRDFFADFQVELANDYKGFHV